MAQHAYIILAHNDSYCLKSLVTAIDDKRNDIFIIPDKKADKNLTSEITTHYSQLHILQSINRINTKWGGISLVKAELTGFKFALRYGNYDHIHLISGQDLPLKNQDFIHSYFERIKGKNLVGLAQGEDNKNDLIEKTRYYYFFIEQFKNPNRIIRGFLNKYRSCLVNIQRMLKIRRKWEIPLYKGCEWVSITSEFARYLIENEKLILKMFRWAPCSDEIYKQTFLMRSTFKDTNLSFDKDFANMTRLIDWERGKPYVWRSSDFEELISSEALFARKFNSNIDKEIIDLIKDSTTR